MGPRRDIRNDVGTATLELWQPNLGALPDGLGDGVTITAAQVQAMDDFLTGLSAAGSPALQQAIADERARLGDLDDFVGLTMEEARRAVVGYGVYLPLVSKESRVRTSIMTKGENNDGQVQ